MPSTCEFYLSNHDAVYHSGDTISCTIVLNTTSPKDVREITITLLGQAYVKWTEREQHGKTQTCVDYKAKEPYLDNTVTVSRVGTLPAGTHTYNYDIVLPPESRASFEGPHGHIRYELTLKLIRLYRFNNEFTKVLTVINKQDLNLNPVLRIPIENEEMLTSVWCCGTGKINIKLKIPFGGYAIDHFPIYDTPATTEGETIISVQYLLRATLKICGSADTISIPIFVGDVPFKECLVKAEPLETESLTAPTVEELLSLIKSAR